MSVCKGCHWERSGLCYEGTPTLDADGNSEKVADTLCGNFWNSEDGWKSWDGGDTADSSDTPNWIVSNE